MFEVIAFSIRHSKGHGNKGIIIFVQGFPSIQKMKIVHLLFASRASLQCDVSSGLFNSPSRLKRLFHETTLVLSRGKTGTLAETESWS